VAQDGCFNEKTKGGKSRDTVYETGPRKMSPGNDPAQHRCIEVMILCTLLMLNYMISMFISAGGGNCARQ
jgi:hypothetical protein